MILLELDPNIVKPGWTPLLILVGLGVVMALLFRSMRRQFRRVDAHWPEEAAAAAERHGRAATESRGRSTEPATDPVVGTPAEPIDGPPHRS